MAYRPESCAGLFALNLMYVLFFLAYVAATVIFAVVFDNKWSAAGYGFVCFLIVIRICLVAFSPDFLLRMFPPRSYLRVFYVFMMICFLLASLVLSVVMVIVGLSRHERWTGTSYFCSFIAWLMSAKWCCFDLLAMYRLRYDVVHPEVIFDQREYEAESDRKFIQRQDKYQKITDDVNAYDARP